MTVLMHFCELYKTNLHTHACKGIPTSTFDRSKHNLFHLTLNKIQFLYIESIYSCIVITDHIRFYFNAYREYSELYSKKI